jgi:hypothetical protein
MCVENGRVKRLRRLAVFHSPAQNRVTSNLDLKIQSADHGQGGSGVRRGRGPGPKSFVLKILTSKPLSLKILQTIFCRPRASQGIPRGGGRGGTPEFTQFGRLSGSWLQGRVKFIFSRNPQPQQMENVRRISPRSSNAATWHATRQEFPAHIPRPDQVA